MLLNTRLHHCIASYCFVCALSGLTTSALAAPQSGQSHPHKYFDAWTPISVLPDPQRVAKAQQIETFKMAGLTGDRSHIPEMITALKELQPLDKQYTAWLALSRLGATEAVPKMDAELKIIRYSPDTPLGEFARACRARLLAETEATPHAKAVRYFQEIGQGPKQLNSAFKKYYQEQVDHPRMTPVDPCRLRNAEAILADMIYHGPAAELLADPLVQQVDFHQVSDAMEKIELALLTPDQQRQKLIDTILLTPTGWMSPAQLLIDLGRLEAINALKVKLQQVTDDPAKYPLGAALQLSHIIYIADDDTKVKFAWGDASDKFEVHQFRHDY